MMSVILRKLSISPIKLQRRTKPKTTRRPSEIIRLQCSTSFMLSSVRSLTCDSYQCFISFCFVWARVSSTQPRGVSYFLCCRWDPEWSRRAVHQGPVCRLPGQSRAAEGISEEEGEGSSGQTHQRVPVWWQRVRLINKTVHLFII